MLYTISTFLFTLSVLPQVGGQEVVAPSTAGLNQQQQAELELQGVAENFNGSASLRHMQELLQQGTNPNAQDSAGDTALLLLCHVLEKDYRYLHDAHFAQAVDMAFEQLLGAGADAMHENAAGCSALFYMQSKPELLNVLQQKKLLPKELSIRIPYDTLALNRYMRMRVNQANLTTHEECRSYLSRKYCAPAYDRVENKLRCYLSCEAAERIPEGAIEDCLAFLRLADAERAANYVNNLVYWQHGEHFIEEIPIRVLQALHNIYWEVDAAKLRSALQRLQTLLPKEGEDMISCNSARPLILVLEMLERQEGQAVLPLIQEFTRSRDPEVAYYACRILLKQNNLLAPEPGELEKAWEIDPQNPAEAKLNTTQRHLYESARVDEAMRTGQFDNLTVDVVQRVETQLRSEGLTPYADAVAMLLQDGALSADPYVRQSAVHRYRELVSPAPRATNALYILRHPEQFKVSPTHTP